MRIDRVVGALSGVISVLGVILATSTPSGTIRQWAFLSSLGFAIIFAAVIAWEIIQWLRPSSPRNQEASTPAAAFLRDVRDEAVVSINQSGGQTARHIVNLGAQPRTLKGRNVSEVSQYLRRFAGTHISVSCQLGDDEAAAFAEDLKHLLVQAGWDVDGVNQVLRTPPPDTGTGLGFPGEDLNAYPWVAGLGERLIAMGFSAYAAMNSQQSELFVGRA